MPASIADSAVVWPALIDVAVDPTEYRAQFEAIRGAPGAAART